ncbi:MAG TPA: hypothetical protein VMB18_09685 [Terriglobales bacterium]|nr:hypothetical protein [Terriglobales bacterium]
MRSRNRLIALVAGNLVESGDETSMGECRIVRGVDYGYVLQHG